MLFEMLAGRVPFDGDNAVAIAMKQVSSQPPPPSSINPEVPLALDSVVLKALAKDPAERYLSAPEMSAALDAAEANPHLAGHTERYEAYVPPAEEDTSNKWWWIGGIVALLLVALAIWFFFIRGGDEGVLVPGVTGKDVTTARLELQKAGFEADVDELPNDSPEGTVIEQDPRGGTRADEGSTVTLSVSSGPQPIRVPDVTGKTEAQATKRLNRAGFDDITIDSRQSQSVDSGLVIETNPAAGSKVVPGRTTVTVTVSSGVKTFTIPSVVGQDRIAAAQTLRDAGLVVNQEPRDDDAPEDQVIEQQPAAGSTAEEGDEVTIVYSTGAGSIDVPSYVGQKQAYAERKLQNLGLEVSVTSQDTDQESEDGIVLSQSPANETVTSGTRVQLVVGVYVPPDTSTTTPETSAP
jgi:serine/threonine-protein kinase